jgi:hypothetical protein
VCVTRADTNPRQQCICTSTCLKNRLPEEAAELAVEAAELVAAPALLAPWAKAPPLAVFAAEATPEAPDATALAPAPAALEPVHRLGVGLQTTGQVLFDLSALHTVQYRSCVMGYLWLGTGVKTLFQQPTSVVARGCLGVAIFVQYWFALPTIVCFVALSQMVVATACWLLLLSRI